MQVLRPHVCTHGEGHAAAHIHVRCILVDLQDLGVHVDGGGAGSAQAAALYLGVEAQVLLAGGGEGLRDRPHPLAVGDGGELRAGPAGEEGAVGVVQVQVFGSLAGAHGKRHAAAHVHVQLVLVDLCDRGGGVRRSPEDGRRFKGLFFREVAGGRIRRGFFLCQRLGNIFRFEFRGLRFVLGIARGSRLFRFTRLGFGRAFIRAFSGAFIRRLVRDSGALRFKVCFGRGGVLRSFVSRRFRGRLCRSFRHLRGFLFDDLFVDGLFFGGLRLAFGPSLRLVGGGGCFLFCGCFCSFVCGRRFIRAFRRVDRFVFCRSGGHLVGGSHILGLGVFGGVFLRLDRGLGGRFRRFLYRLLRGLFFRGFTGHLGNVVYGGADKGEAQLALPIGLDLVHALQRLVVDEHAGRGTQRQALYGHRRRLYSRIRKHRLACRVQHLNAVQVVGEGARTRVGPVDSADPQPTALGPGPGRGGHREQHAACLRRLLEGLGGGRRDHRLFRQVDVPDGQVGHLFRRQIPDLVGLDEGRLFLGDDFRQKVAVFDHGDLLRTDEGRKREHQCQQQCQYSLCGMLHV